MFDLESYDYFLPSELIASSPVYPKENAKLLVYNRSDKSITHTTFANFFSYIPKDVLVVINDTKVLNARIYGVKETGGKSEILFHNFLDSNPKTTAIQTICQVRGKAKKNTTILLDSNYSAKIIDSLDSGKKIIEFYLNSTQLESRAKIFDMLDQIGKVPLPPYIKREATQEDKNDYQSVFAKNLGSIAAPTASLHFSTNDLKILESNFKICPLTLHVGAGTFFSVESSDIRDHKMHSEFMRISKNSRHLLDSSNKVLCIGSTALRSVEFYKRQNIESNDMDFIAQNDIFLHIGNPPKFVDFLLTNFHLPKTTLLMLVASMIGLDETKLVYQEAIKAKYRFYSYGDGMLIL